MVRSGVAVEKLAFSEESRNLRDRTCLGDCEKSFLELPDAKHLCEFLMSEFFNSHRIFSTSISILEPVRQSRTVNLLPCCESSFGDQFRHPVTFDSPIARYGE
jgi:hypothetical protein